ncbi:MAG: hypothetical protein JW745_04225 [Sedimentisphaerales bacterium]|nr:hypothetical protein [Sedimentisphaerales bacterium]MBN2844066.1 hypothetical protein [Sedimentisphaerales bacterium]
MKKVVSLILTALCFSLSSGMVSAQDIAEEPAGLGVALDSTFVSKYMWRGYDIYDDHGAWQPSVTFDLFGTGFSLNIWGSQPIGSGNEELTETDVTAAYYFQAFSEEKYAVDVTFDFVYFGYPKANHLMAAHEAEVWLSMPNLLQAGEIAIVPGYCFATMWPDSSGVAGVSGAFHVLSLAANMPLPGTEQVISLSSQAVYNDGAYAADHDWSNAAFGLSTSFEAGSICIKPSLNYQISMDDSVNTDDEIWAGLSLSTSF